MLEFYHLFLDFLMVFFNFWHENPWQCQIKMCKTCFAVNRIRVKNFLVCPENYRTYDRSKFLPILSPKFCREIFNLRFNGNSSSLIHSFVNLQNLMENIRRCENYSAANHWNRWSDEIEILMTTNYRLLSRMYWCNRAIYFNMNSIAVVIGCYNGIFNMKSFGNTHSSISVSIQNTRMFKV